MSKNILKMEIELDKNVLISNGYDFEKSMNILCRGFKNAGFLQEVREEGHIIFAGTGSDKDFAYFALITDKLLEQKWFKDGCVIWNWYNGNGMENWKEAWQRLGRW